MNKQLLYIGSGLGLLLLLVFLVALTGQSKQPIIVSIPSQEFSEFTKDTTEFTLLDIRTPQEFNAGHLPGAFNIDYYDASFKQQLDALDKNKRYIIYCRSGNRSKGALRIMEELGFREVYELQEGIATCC